MQNDIIIKNIRHFSSELSN